MPTNPPSPLSLTDRERRSAVLHIAFCGYPPQGDRAVAWLFESVRASPDHSLHLSDAVRELADAFPALTRPDEVVERLLLSPLADVYMTWRRDQDGVVVYDGTLPCHVRLPAGQDPFRPGFDINQWLYLSRPQTPMKVSAA